MPFHHRGLENLYLDASAIAIGSFDGVHQGHQHIINRLTAYAGIRSIPVVVITFFPHPVIVLRHIEKPYYLTLPDERASILFQLGVEHVVTVPFTLELSGQTPFEFMNWLNRHIHPKYVVVGEDFTLGKDRKGNPETLREIGQTLGYEVETVPLMGDEQDRVSSSRIRSNVKEGNIETATALLGHPYTIPVQISAQPSNHPEEEITILEMTADPMQLLPGQGLYEAVLETHSDVHFPVYIKPGSGDPESGIIGLFPLKSGKITSRKTSGRLSFHSRLEKLPTEVLDLAEEYPLISEINAVSKGK